jgi:hypothetical protein
MKAKVVGFINRSVLARRMIKRQEIKPWQIPLKVNLREAFRLAYLKHELK